MQTNSPRQQTTRLMKAADKASSMALRIAQDHEVNATHAAKFRATVTMWHAAHDAGLTPAELHALDMALVHGADPTELLRTIDPRTPEQREQDDAEADWQSQVRDLRACM